MNVYNNMAFALRLRRLPEEEIKPRVREAARLLEIEGQLEHKPHELSGGQRQRVAVGRAIVRQPKIFLFDEPLSNLDATLRATMRVEMARLHQRLRATILYVTHDQAEAMTLGERIIVLKDGEIQQIGSPSEVYHKPINTFVAGFVGSPQMNLIEGKIAESGVVLENGGLRVDLTAVLSGRRVEYAGKTLTVGIRPEDLHPVEPERAWIRGEVEIVEDLGSDRFAHLRCGPLELIARLPSHVSLRRGQILHFAAQPDRLHLFYQKERIQ